MTELMEHIIIGCMQGTANLIWRLVHEAWDNSTYQWPRISLGIALGCRNLKAIPHQQNKTPDEPQVVLTTKRGATRLLQILISEATHLIWVLRCERVIQERTHVHHEIKV